MVEVCVRMVEVCVGDGGCVRRGCCPGECRGWWRCV